MEWEIRFSEHALVRMQQRGISREAVEMIFKFADRRIPVGKGDRALEVRARRIDELRRRGEICAQTAERIKGVRLIVADLDGPEPLVVTVEHGYRRKLNNWLPRSRGRR
ncbi:MAG: DUF4258 domain-containing protein [Cellvibrionales bacterium]|nr:DUF4258 domain-containing protein [Cellvibrionales bacterium]